MTIPADEKKLFFGDRVGNLKLMSLTDGKTIKYFGKIHNTYVNGILITADEKFFFTSSPKGELKQWSYRDATLVRDYGKITDQIKCLCL